MINIRGQLSVRTIAGKFGDFNVGRLATSIGDFSIKDALLEQLSEGKYSGDFVITEIRPSSYSYAGRFVIEVRAKLDSMQLDDMNDLPPEEAERIETTKAPDPIDEEGAPELSESSKPARPSEKPAPFGMTPEELEALKSKEDLDGDATLFGIHWPLGKKVKLDATVDRHTMRAQRDRLLKLGYKFNYQDQVWEMSN